MFTLKQIFKIVNLILSWFFSPFLSIVISQVFSLENRNFSRPQGKYFSSVNKPEFSSNFYTFFVDLEIHQLFHYSRSLCKIDKPGFWEAPTFISRNLNMMIIQILGIFSHNHWFFLHYFGFKKGWTFEKLTFSRWPASARPPLGKLIHLAILGAKIQLGLRTLEGIFAF